MPLIGEMPAEVPNTDCNSVILDISSQPHVRKIQTDSDDRDFALAQIQRQDAIIQVARSVEMR